MILGVTGGISTGKSTAADVIAKSGVRIIDCDEVSRYLTSYDPTVLTAIYEHFGSKVFHRFGQLRRAELARIVFSDEQERRALERILHPQIKAVVLSNIETAMDHDEPLVIAAPLLIEAGMAGLMDRLWVISCSPENQLIRLCQRSGITQDQARIWINAQMSLEEKEKYADTVIRNDGAIEDFRATVAQEWDALVAELPA
jgi:dephospho-CoA kinase